MNWEQLKTIFWLRWRLMRNQHSRGSALNTVINLLVAVGMIGLSAMSFAGGLLGAAFGLREAPPLLIMGIWFGLTVAFLLFWMIGLLAELQRSETIDLQRLMHLPVALGQMFVINYLASHLALSVVLMLPAMIGLAIGLVIARGPAMLLLLPLALGMVFMVTAWTYCLRGWLSAMMSNPRRRRTVIMCVTLAFVLVGQAPNLYFNVFNRVGRRSEEKRAAKTPEEQRERNAPQKDTLKALLAMQKFVPPLWVPVGAQALAEGRMLPGLLGTLGCFTIGALGLRRAYRGTVRFYRGDTGRRVIAKIDPVRAPASAAATASAGTRFLELHIPAVPEQGAALALATFRSMLRAPEVKMAWATSFIVTIILGATAFRSASNLPEAVKPFVATGAVAFSLFTLVQFLANHFGFDRHGFRSLVLSPADRRVILLGKNLASLPIGGAFGVLLLTFASVWLRLPLLGVVAALFQLLTLLLLVGLGGNLLSILVPYRIEAGSMKPTKMKGTTMLVMMLCHLLFPFVMMPVFVPPLAELLCRMAGVPPVVPINLLLSITLAALAAFVYWRTLGPLGRLLQRRETKILSVVTVEVE